VTPAALQRLMQYDWPGNIRQLRLVLERAARMAAPGPIEVRHLPILQAVQRQPVPMGWTAAAPLNLQELIDNIERQLIGSALSRTNQNQAKAAELLGIPRTTLRDKLEKYGFTPRARAEQAGQ
jgi:two-component system response regulator AtoC